MKNEVLYAIFLILLGFLVIVVTIGYLQQSDGSFDEEIRTPNSIDLPYEGARPQYPHGFPQPASDNLGVDQNGSVDTVYDDRVLLRNNNWYYHRIEAPDDMYFEETLALPEDGNFSMPVFYHRSFNLTEEYLADMMAWFFPEIDLDVMTIDFDPPSKFDPGVIVFPKPVEYPYVLVENETCAVELTAYGGVFYSLKELPDTATGGVSNKEEAQAVAAAFVLDHGGFPLDVGGPSTWLLPVYGSFGEPKPWNASYSVRWSRDLMGLSIEASNRHRISVSVEPTTGAVVGFGWHWPDLGSQAVLEGIPSMNETLQHYGFDTGLVIWKGGWPNARYFNSWELVYLMPDFMDPFINESVEGNHYYAPYWELTSNEGENYYIPIIHPARP